MSFWYEELDNYLREFLRGNSSKVYEALEGEIASGALGASRGARAENARKLLELSATLENQSWLNPNNRGSARRELKLAHGQFNEADYLLIRLCYGEISNEFLLLSNIRIMRGRLNRYFTKNDVSALDELFKEAQDACESLRCEPDTAGWLPEWELLLDETFVAAMLFIEER